MKQKLKSKKGASVIFALLLFLVCAVLCSVIIMAAATSAGRMAGLAESDQRYYSVTSASSLLEKAIEGKTVEVTSEETYYADMVYSNGSVVSEAEGERTTKASMVCDGVTTDISDGETPIFQSIPESASYRYYRLQKDGVAPAAEMISITTDILDMENDPLDVSVAEYVDADGNLILTVQNTNGEKKFTQTLTFSPDITSNESVKSEEGNRRNISGTSYTVTKTQKTVKTDKIKWKLAGIKNVAL